MKFTGNFKKLKSLGYTFQRLYAGNRICYHKGIGEQKYDKIWVWSKGRQIEYEDWYSNTKGIFEALLTVEWDKVPFTNNKYKGVSICFSHHNHNIKPIVNYDKRYYDNVGDDKKEYMRIFKIVLETANKICFEYPEGYDRHILVFEFQFLALKNEIELINAT